MEPRALPRLSRVERPRMSEESWHRLRPLLEELLARPPHLRAEELTRLAERDAALARELTALLRHDEEAARDGLEPPDGHGLAWLLGRPGAD